MSTLFHLRVDKLYNVVRKRQESMWRPAIQYHVGCNQSFNCYWPRAYMSNVVDTDYSDHYHCIKCGEEIDASKFTATGFDQDRVPVSMDLSIVERRGQLDVVFKYDSVVIDAEFGQVMKGRKPKRTDIIRFDFKKREVRYIKRGVSRASEESIIEPFDSREYYWLKTPFSWIRADYSCLLVYYRDELKEFASTLKQAFIKQLSKVAGYTVPGVRQYGEISSKFGMFASLFGNLIFRMAAPDAPSLSPQLIEDYHCTRGASNNGQMSDILVLTKAGHSWIDACIKSLNVSNTSYVRRYVAKRPFLITQTMWFIEGFISDVNHRRTLFEFMMDSLQNTPAQRWMIDGHRLTQGLRDFLRLYRFQKGEAAAMRAVLSSDSYYEMRDAANMYFGLNRQQRKEFWSMKIKARDVHDTLMALNKKSRIENIPVQNGKRYDALAGTVDGYEFSLPKETHELVDVGTILHNCVATYANRVVGGETAIVTVKKDNKLLACIEVVPKFKAGRFNEIHQAKIFGNDRASRDAELNNAIIDWADKTNLFIHCHDVIYRNRGGMAV